MAKTIPQYRQEKYDKYDFIDEGKLFYRHEKNLDLVNVSEKLLYFIEGDIDKSQLEDILLYDRIEPTLKQIIRKIKQDIFAVYKYELLINNKKLSAADLFETITWRNLKGNVDYQIRWLVFNFLLWELDTKVYLQYQNGKFLIDYKNIALVRKTAVQMWLNTIDHEHQHYLFHSYFSTNKNISIHYRIIDEICAKLVSRDWVVDDLREDMKMYIGSYIENPIWLKYIFEEKNFVWKLKNKRRNLIYPSHVLQWVQQGSAFCVFMPVYVEMACAFVDLFEKLPELKMDKQKAIRLLSMTSPHYRKDLLKYYTKLAQHMKQKSMTSSEQ